MQHEYDIVFRDIEDGWVTYSVYRGGRSISMGARPSEEEARAAARAAARNHTRSVVSQERTERYTVTD